MLPNIAYVALASLQRGRNLLTKVARRIWTQVQKSWKNFRQNLSKICHPPPHACTLSLSLLPRVRANVIPDSDRLPARILVQCPGTLEKSSLCIAETMGHLLLGHCFNDHTNLSTISTCSFALLTMLHSVYTAQKIGSPETHVTSTDPCYQKKTLLPWAEIPERLPTALSLPLFVHRSAGEDGRLDVGDEAHPSLDGAPTHLVAIGQGIRILQPSVELRGVSWGV